MVFVCHSWLLFLGNREILPAHLNMVDFINDFRILESYERDEFGDKWRVFGADFEKPDAELPEDTRNIFWCIIFAEDRIFTTVKIISVPDNVPYYSF